MSRHALLYSLVPLVVGYLLGSTAWIIKPNIDVFNPCVELDTSQVVHK